ncbi:MAG: hypothetical protein ABL308_12760 [Oceanicaulis sp.]
MSFILGSLALHANLRRPGRDDGAAVRKLILIAFCNEATDGGVIPAQYAGKTSNDRLADIACRSVATVKRAKAQLVEDNWLALIGHARRGRGRVALYRVNVDLLRANIRAREAEIFAVEPEGAGTPVDLDDDIPGEAGDQGAAGVSGSNSADKGSQGAENIGPICNSGSNSDPVGENRPAEPGKVAQLSAKSGSTVSHNPINPSPPCSPPPPDREASAVDWRGLREGLTAALGREAGLNLISGARLQGSTLLFANGFKFAEARDRHSRLLGGLGVRVIALDAPRSESIALDNLHTGKRAAR